MARTYSVPGISCGHCKDAIEGTLSELSGIDRVEVDIEGKTVTVEGDATDDAILAGIEDAGYEVATPG